MDLNKEGYFNQLGKEVKSLYIDKQGGGVYDMQTDEGDRFS